MTVHDWPSLTSHNERGRRGSAERGQRLSSAPDLLNDAVRIRGPDEGFGTFVGLGQKAVYGRLEVDDPAEGAALQPLAGQFGKEALDPVQPGRRGRSEVKLEARVPRGGS